ncbi:hypothetical protein RFI_28352 [Reticulomyxa filosa]|uniref:Uncharacterized protein n=1 Tax=Reticulomyxa filosa TaxID=46433 RepID=X6M551_RETFI|nr:hypothetical protein RFI_28352 [Reticulomyxa filosa]|eukprot:ETO09034.1 hypothetical protein RFI_28352 [Reticulomyxa filosa]
MNRVLNGIDDMSSWSPRLTPRRSSQFTAVSHGAPYLTPAISSAMSLNGQGDRISMIPLSDDDQDTESDLASELTFEESPRTDTKSWITKWIPKLTFLKPRMDTRIRSNTIHDEMYGDTDEKKEKKKEQSVPSTPVKRSQSVISPKNTNTALQLKEQAEIKQKQRPMSNEMNFGMEEKSNEIAVKDKDEDKSKDNDKDKEKEKNTNKDKEDPKMDDDGLVIIDHEQLQKTSDDVMDTSIEQIHETALPQLTRQQSVIDKREVWSEAHKRKISQLSQQKHGLLKWVTNFNGNAHVCHFPMQNELICEGKGMFLLDKKIHAGEIFKFQLEVRQTPDHSQWDQNLWWIGILEGPMGEIDGIEERQNYPPMEGLGLCCDRGCMYHGTKRLRSNLGVPVIGGKNLDIEISVKNGNLAVLRISLENFSNIPKIHHSMKISSDYVCIGLLHTHSKGHYLVWTDAEVKANLKRKQNLHSEIQLGHLEKPN